MAGAHKPTKSIPPLLRLDVLGEDGMRASAVWVFCHVRHASIRIDEHVDCECSEFADRESGVLRVGRSTDGAPDSSHGEADEIEIGGMLHEGAIAVTGKVELRDALALMRAENRRALPVVDEKHGTVLGVLHETTLVARASSYPGETIEHGFGAAMSRGMTMHEAMPVKRALRALASAHLREATVVNDEGTPIGVFRDIDGLHFLSVLRGRAGK